MSNDTKQIDTMGIFVSGQIMARNHYPGSQGKPDRYSFDVAVPGQRQMLNISVNSEDWLNREVMTPYKGKVTFNLFNGRIYIQPAKS